MHQPTLLAIAAVVYLAAKVVHEGLGHGGACVLTGHELVGFTTSWCDCTVPPEHVGAERIVTAAGTVANLAIGGLAFVFLRGDWAPATRYALWLTAAVNSLLGAGYLFADPLFGFGDWTSILDSYGVPTSLRVVWGVCAGAIYVGLGFLLLRALEPLLGATQCKPKARALMLWPYLLIGGGLMTAAALRNPLGPVYALTSALATVGGTSALAWMSAAAEATGSRTDVVIPRNNGWLLAGVAAMGLAVFVFGPGVFPNG